MKHFDISLWNERDIGIQTLTGGGLNYDDIGFETVMGKRVLTAFRRPNPGARVKFMEALEEADAGNTYHIRVRVMLGKSCTQNTAHIMVCVMDPMKWFPDFCCEPVEVGKDAFVEISFTHTITEVTQNSVCVEQVWRGEPVAEEILIESVTTELVSRTDTPTPPDLRPTLWLLGDSITCYYDPSRLTNGWGMHIGDWLDTEKLRICNMARGGFSTKSFAATEGLGLWTHVCRNMKPGDYLMVSLGINDHSSSRPERRVTHEEYAAYLEHFVVEASHRGVFTYLITPTVTIEKNPPENFRRSRAEVMLSVANKKAKDGCGVIGLDLNAHMMADIEKIMENEGYEFLLNTYFCGESDTTHQRAAGSRWVTSMIVELLDKAPSPFLAYRKDLSAH